MGDSNISSKTALDMDHISLSQTYGGNGLKNIRLKQRTPFHRHGKRETLIFLWGTVNKAIIYLIKFLCKMEFKRMNELLH